MITHRHTTKWIALVMAVAVCLCLAAVACPEQIKALAGETGVSMEYETALFNTDEVMQVNILMDSDDWDEMLENAMEEEDFLQCRNPAERKYQPFFHCQRSHDGPLQLQVGI